jgi:exonuclease III
MACENILVWNVRGLKARGHCDMVCQLVYAERISLVCLQETKLETISDYDVAQIVGTGFDYFFLPSLQTRGGILVAWHAVSWVPSGMSSRTFSVSVRLHQACGAPEWWLTMAYGPSRDEDKPLFLVELHDLRLLRGGPLLLCGDFNMIYRAQDKNKNRVNRRLMDQFCHFLNTASLQEAFLNGHLFMWSNEREYLMLERIDRVFSKEWNAIFPGHELLSLSSLCSDHAPLLLRTDNECHIKKRFHFRAFWPRFLGFAEVVA